jgi:hypothetical protein
MRDLLNTFHGYPLDKVKIRLSRTHATHKAGSFKHHEHDRLPQLHYHFGKGSNLNEDSPLLTEKKEDLLRFKNDFWQTLNKDGQTYQQEYENDLYRVVLDAINGLTEKWNTRYVDEVNKAFKE